MFRPFPAQRLGTALVVAIGLAFAAAPVMSLEKLEFSVTSDDEDLARALRGASLLLPHRAEAGVEAVDLFADAQAEYARLLEVLYDQGHFSAVIRVTLDGREAATIDPLSAPARIDVVRVTVDPGPRFTFSQAEIAPLPPPRRPIDGFAAGEVASTGVIRLAVEEGIERWRRVGHAKATVAGQDLVADHQSATLAASIDLEPGPKLRFGPLLVTGNTRMRASRIVEIAGLPEGEVFSSRDLERAAERLRRSGVFSTVGLEEDAAITAPDLLGITARVTEAKPRRLSLGVEASTQDGLKLGAEWLHRNLFGGGERFSIGVEVANIAATGSGADYGLTLGIERPATPFTDTTAGITLALDHLDEVDYLADSAALGLTFRHVFSPELSASLGLGYDWIGGTDALGDFRYQSLNLPLGLTWDRRDSKLDATRLYLVDLGVKPFMGFGATGDGARVTFDLRGYRALDADRRFVLAARVQGGTILGAGALDAPRDELFYSGGGGSVRGQPYQSLGLTVMTPDGPVGTGGTSFAAGSLEARLKFAGGWGGAAFVDVGTVGDQGLSGLGEVVHAGAGLGLRYDTGFGPLRFDIAAPVAGDTGTGPQIYVGLGQAF